jgi:hypothetical protein
VEILSIVATSQTIASPSPTPSPAPTPTPSPSLPTPEPGVTPDPAALQEDEGYVVAVASAPYESVTIKTQRIKLTGEIITEDRTFTLSPSCIITRGTGRVYLSDVRVNDIAAFKYSGTVLYSLTLQEKDRIVRGTLVEKKYVEASDTPVLVIEDAVKVKHELRVTASTLIERGTLRNLSWTDLRVGDDIEAKCEYDRLLNVYAPGTRGSVSGRLTSILISAASQEITLQKADGTSAVYKVPAGAYDIYSLRIGMDLTLYLDSWEVYDISQTVPASYGTAPVTIVGYINAIRADNSIEVVEQLSNMNSMSYIIRIDDGTFNAASNLRFDMSQLRVGMNVQITMTDNASFTARMVQILP